MASKGERNLFERLEDGRRSVIGISILTAVCLFGDSMLYVVLPIRFREAGLVSLWEVGILLSVNRLVRLPLNPLAGWMLGKIGTKNGMVFAGILGALTTGSYAVFEGFPAWIVLRCLWGLSWTFLRLGGCFAVLDVSAGSNRGRLMGTFNGLYRLGSLAGMLLGGFLADLFGLKTAAAVFGALSFAALPFVFRSLPRSHGLCVRAESSLPRPPAVRDVLPVLLTGLLIALVYSGVFTSSLSRLIEVHYDKTISVFGAVLGAASIGGIVQALRWAWEPFAAPKIGRLSDGPSGRRPLLAATLAVSSVLFALVPFRLPVLLWLALVLAVLFTATALSTVADAMACDAASQAGNRMLMAAYTFAVDLGAALGPLIGYAADGLWGPFAIYRLIAVVLLVTAIGWFVRRRPGVPSGVS